MDRDNGCVSPCLSFLETFIIACVHDMHVGLDVGPKVQRAKMCLSYFGGHISLNNSEVPHCLPYQKLVIVPFGCV
jgi:hypothetical protein